MTIKVKTIKRLNRQELKAESRQRFLTTYWPCVAVSATVLLLSWLTGLIWNGWQGWSSLPGFNLFWGRVLHLQAPKAVLPTTASMLPSMARLMLLTTVTSFLVNFVSLESRRFFVRVSRGEAVAARTFFAGLLTDWRRKVLGLLWLGLWELLWFGAAIAPGAGVVWLALRNVALSPAWMSLLIGLVSLWALAGLVFYQVKIIAYFQYYYVLLEEPELSVRQALRQSIRLMDGRKGEYFVLLLSFFWALLCSVITFDLSGVFFTHGYQNTTLAGYYDFLNGQRAKHTL